MPPSAPSKGPGAPHAWWSTPERRFVGHALVVEILEIEPRYGANLGGGPVTLPVGVAELGIPGRSSSTVRVGDRVPHRPALPSTATRSPFGSTGRPAATAAARSPSPPATARRSRSPRAATCCAPPPASPPASTSTGSPWSRPSSPRRRRSTRSRAHRSVVRADHDATVVQARHLLLGPSERELEPGMGGHRVLAGAAPTDLGTANSARCVRQRVVDGPAAATPPRRSASRGRPSARSTSRSRCRDWPRSRAWPSSCCAAAAAPTPTSR